MADEATFDLFRRLGYTDPRRLPRVATLAALLAHVRGPSVPERFGTAIGDRKDPQDSKTARLKPERFRALMAAEGEEEILRGFRRAVDLLDGRANVADLARIVLTFDREETRRELAFDYFGAGIAQPDAPNS